MVCPELTPVNESAGAQPLTATKSLRFLCGCTKPGAE